MQPVFNALFICLFICINRTVNGATLWPGLFAQSVLRTPPVFWPPATYHTSPELGTVNLQQSESHLLGSAEHHMISSDDPIPSGLFIPVDQLHRELYSSQFPHLLRKHSSNHYPSYHQFNQLNQYPSHFKKVHSSTKHHPATSKFKNFNKNFLNRKKHLQHQSHHQPQQQQQSKEEFASDKFAYLDDDSYAKHLDLFNFNRLTGNLFGEYGDSSPEQIKNWKVKQNEQTNALASEEQLDSPDEDDLFTIKNNEQFTYLQPKQQQQQKTGSSSSNGRIDLRKSSKRKQQLKDHLKELREYRDTKDVKEYRKMSEFNEMRDREKKEDQKVTNENRYIDNYDNRSNGNNEPATLLTDKKYTENRNIERYNLEKFFNNEKFSQMMRNDGRISISNNSQINGNSQINSNSQINNNNNQANRNEKSVFTSFKSPNGELSVISETIYQNHHQLKNDNRRSPSRLVLMQNYDRQFEPVNADKQYNDSITILANNLSSNNQTDNSPHSSNQLQNDFIKLSNHNKLDANENQANQQVYGTTWTAERIIPTPQISFMQTMLTESNTIPTNDQSTKTTNYLSERSQLNQNNNHFSTFAISAIIIASLIAALLFTGSSLFIMYKVSQIKRRRLMRFQETANRNQLANQFEAVFPVQSTTCNTSGQRTSNKSLDTNATLSNNIISNNNFIRQQKSLFSNLNSRCNAGKSMLQMEPNSNFTIKPSKMATINKKAGKHINLTNGECYVTQMKTSSSEKNSALSRLLSKMTNQADETNIRTDQPPTNQLQNAQKVSFF